MSGASEPGGIAPKRGSTPATIAVRGFDPLHDGTRDRFVRAHANGTIFHLAGWRRSVERVFGHEGRDLVAYRGAELVGVLPLALVRTPFGKKHLLSVPYAVYGGPLGEDQAVVEALAAEASRQARLERVGRLELRCFADPGLDLVPSNLYSAFLQAIPAERDEIWSRMPKRARAEVRKTIEKNGLVVSQGDWYIDDLYELFHLSKKQLGSPALPRAWYRTLAEELGDGIVVHVARAGSQPIAATLSFVFEKDFNFYYIGVTAEGNREYSVTNFLTTRLQEWCFDRGLKRFDLGRSRVDSGPYQFKKNQGFEPVPLAYRYDLVKSRALPSFNPSNPRTAKLREAWSKLPDWVTRRLSDPLMRYLP